MKVYFFSSFFVLLVEEGWKKRMFSFRRFVGYSLGRDDEDVGVNARRRRRYSLEKQDTGVYTYARVCVYFFFFFLFGIECRRCCFVCATCERNKKILNRSENFERRYTISRIYNDI